MSFVQHLKGRALNSCQSCLRSRLKGKGLKENHVGTKGLLNYFEYFETSPRRKQDLYEQLGTTKAKVEMLERELQLGTLAAEGSIPDIMNEKLQVYRLLRSDEEPAKGLYSKAVHCKDDAAWRMPVSEHIETGSNVTSRFISTSKRLDVCLFFASKAIHERGTESKELRIAETNLDLSRGYVLDLRDERNRREWDIPKYSKTDNYAKCFEEVIVDRCISPDEVVRVFQPVSGLPRANKYTMFAGSSFTLFYKEIDLDNLTRHEENLTKHYNSVSDKTSRSPQSHS
jgi:hypothetical protein